MLVPMTPDEAKRHYCPMTFNGASDCVHSEFCVAVQCMWWVWYGDPAQGHGHCGRIPERG